MSNSGNKKVWVEFCDRIGWRKEGEWLSHSNNSWLEEKSIWGQIPSVCRADDLSCLKEEAIGGQIPAAMTYNALKKKQWDLGTLPAACWGGSSVRRYNMGDCGIALLVLFVQCKKCKLSHK